MILNSKVNSLIKMSYTTIKRKIRKVGLKVRCKI